MHTTKNYGGLDRFRMAAAVLVIAIHTSPLASINENADFFLTRILARTAVPFFLMLTGQFVVTHFLNPSGDALSSPGSVLKRFLKKMGLLYAFCILLYLPIGIYAEHYQKLNPGTFLRMLLFDGTFYHLWYFPACIMGVLLVYGMSRFLNLKAMTAVSAVLYIFGLLGDSYYGLIQKVPFLESVYDFIFQACSYTRNGLFMVPVFLILGAWAGVMAEEEKKKENAPDLMTDCMGLFFSFAVMSGEAFLLRHFKWQRHDSMYLMLIPTMFFLYQCLLACRRKPLKSLRRVSAWIYILHPAFIVVVRAAAKPLKLTALLVENSLVHYLSVTLLSVLAGFLIARIGTLLPSPAAFSFRSRERKIGEICHLIDREEQSRILRETEEDGQAEPAHIREAKKTEQTYSGETDETEQASFRKEKETGQTYSRETDEAEQAPSRKADTNRSSQNPTDIGEAQKSPDETGVDKTDTPEESQRQVTLLSASLNRNPAPPSRKPAGKRAWIELDSAALEQNVAFLRSLLPEHCRLMPAVKAEAYGHGAVIISRLLNNMGVEAFCVACIAEGIALREAGIKGGILILGYTPPEDFPLLRRYHLTQTVVDYSYARLMNRFGNTLHVHLSIDTGMHRLGIRCENLEEIQSVCEMKNLSVDGFFTHLAVSDSLSPQDILFTEAQIQAFYEVIRFLREKGYPCRGLHMLASYGILNLLSGKADEELAGKKTAELHAAEYASDSAFPPVSELAADFVRPGIALYGVLSNRADSNAWRRRLRPVLSLKARVSSVRPLYTGEATGYGAAFVAKKDMRIATISIGYADGLPRELSYGKGCVLINGYKAPVLGRICMDQTIVDVSGIPRIQPGDTAVIIGKSGKLENTADSVAAQCGTITNELLSRLGGRLDRILL